jgi:hypothetical protein
MPIGLQSVRRFVYGRRNAELGPQDDCFTHSHSSRAELIERHSTSYLVR